MAVDRKKRQRIDSYPGIKPEHLLSEPDAKRYPHCATYGEAWIHQVLDYYMMVGPVQFPSGEKDAWGRDLPDAEEIDGGKNQFGMRLGSVYFTRELMRWAWSECSGETGWYIPKNGVAAPSNNIIHFHLDRMLNSLDMGYHGVDQYMFNLNVFEVQRRMDVYHEYLRRKDLYDRRATPTKQSWDVVWREINGSLLVDPAFIQARAESLGIPVHGSAGTDQKIKSWCKTQRMQGGEKEIEPKLRKVARGLYRVEVWQSPYRLPEIMPGIKPIVLQNWRYEFIRRWAAKQFWQDRDKPTDPYSIPNSFSAHDVFDALAGYEFTPNRWDFGYINQQLFAAAVVLENYKEEDDETLFIAHRFGERYRYRINEKLMDKWFGVTIRFDRDQMASRVLQFIGARGQPGEPFWFTVHDLNQIIRKVCGGPLMDFGIALISHLRLHIHPVRSAYSVLSSWHPKYKPEVLIYILNGYGAAQAGYPHPEDFDFEHYEIPLDCDERGEPYEDGLPAARADIDWENDPDYLDAMESVIISYRPPKPPIEPGKGPFNAFVLDRLYHMARGKDMPGEGCEQAALHYLWGWKNAEEPQDKMSPEYAVWLAGRHRAKSGLGFPGENPPFEDKAHLVIFQSMLRAGPVGHLRKYGKIFEDGAFNVSRPLSFESPELAAWLAGRDLGLERYLEKYGERRRFFD